MGDRAALACADRGDTALLVDISSVPGPRIDMGDAGNPRSARGRIEIGVKHAAAAGKLQLGAIAFADLDARLAETRDELVGVQAYEVAQLRPALRPGGSDRLVRGRSAGGEEKGSGGKKSTHG